METEKQSLEEDLEGKNCEILDSWTLIKPESEDVDELKRTM